jgi:bifunctional UDP-N-acetylglucosamine pyrophosphorylase/glucosamine-1-phosphate N-acetyltransferase
MAVADLDAPGSLGRVIARPRRGGSAPREGGDGMLERIVEAADATARELAVRTVNAGLYALPAPEIFAALGRLDSRNAQGELYLTDAVTALAVARGVALVRLADAAEALGVNNRGELAQVHRILVDRKLHRLMLDGVTVVDPVRTLVQADVSVQPDTVLHPDVSLLGRTAVGARCVLHQGAWLRDTTIADGAVIEPYSVLDGSEVGADCRVGPFARLRPGSRVAAGARVGSFVDTKNDHDSSEG